MDAAIDAEPVSEMDRRIEGYHTALHALFKEEDDIVVAQSVASFMGCVMSHSEQWERIVPGFVKEMLDYANLAMAAHRRAAEITMPDKPTTEEHDNGKQS